MIISNSPDISTLDYEVLYDLSLPVPRITLENLSTGPDLASCKWWYVVTDPNGIAIHAGTLATPDMMGAWATEVMPSTWPLMGGQVAYSGAPYKLRLYVQDGADNIYELEKQTQICRPVGNTPESGNNFAPGAAWAKVRCESAQLYVEDRTGYTYQGLIGEDVSRRFTLAYPQGDDDVFPDPAIVDSASYALLPVNQNGSGYTLYQDVVRAYHFTDGLAAGTSVRIKYKFKKTLAVRCNITLCPIVCEYEKLLDRVTGGSCNVTEIRDPEQARKLQVISGKIILALIGLQEPLCGIDVPELVEEIKELGGWDCDCYSGGINGGGGANGSIPGGPGNGGGSAGSVVLNVQSTGGDLEIVELLHQGANIVLKMRDKSYVVNIAPGTPGGIFSITPSQVGQVKTFSLAVDMAELVTYIQNNITFPPSGAQGCCPEYTPVRVHGTNNPPAQCPGSFFPAPVFNAGDTAIIGIAYSPADMVALMNADASWQAVGHAFVTSNCEVGLYRPSGATGTPPVVFVLPAGSGCQGGFKWSTLALVNGCGGVAGQISYPFTGKVTISGAPATDTLVDVSSYADLLAKLMAAPSRPATISFYASPDQTKVMVLDTDCTKVRDVVVEMFRANELVYGANAFNGAQTSGGIFALDVNINMLLGRVCGYPLAHLPFHLMKKGNRLYTVDTDTLDVRAVDVSTPLYPWLVATRSLIGYMAPPLTLDAIHREAFFPTDRNTNMAGPFLYIVESSAGRIWRYNTLTDTVEAHLQDNKLIGKIPRVINGDTLYLSQFGDKEGVWGLNSGVNRRHIVKVDLAAFNNAGITSQLVAPDGDEVWGISYHPQSGNLWMTTRNARLITYDPAAQSVGVTYNNAWGVGAFTLNSGDTVESLNTTIVDETIYVSSIGRGTRSVYLPDVPIGAQPVIFADLIAPGSAQPNVLHHNFNPVPGSCYGLLTYDNQAFAGGVARYTLDGQFIALAQIGSGDMYNVEVFPLTGPSSPNGLCV
jgi:hypothetical protein